MVNDHHPVFKLPLHWEYKPNIFRQTHILGIELDRTSSDPVNKNVLNQHEPIMKQHGFSSHYLHEKRNGPKMDLHNWTYDQHLLELAILKGIHCVPRFRRKSIVESDLKSKLRTLQKLGLPEAVFAQTGCITSRFDVQS